MTSYETGLALGGGLAGFLLGVLSNLIVYYLIVRGRHDYASTIPVAVFAGLSLIALFQTFIIVTQLCPT